MQKILNYRISYAMLKRKVNTKVTVRVNNSCPFYCYVI